MSVLISYRISSVQRQSRLFLTTHTHSVKDMRWIDMRDPLSRVLVVMIESGKSIVYPVFIAF